MKWIQVVALTVLVQVLVLKVKGETRTLRNIDQNVITSDNSEDLIIELPNGKLRGKDNGYYYSYESIPYAEPPVGDLRFENPKLYSQQWNTTFDASKAPVACLQWNQFLSSDNKLAGEEDCLTVSIYKPKLNGQQRKFPVFVEIHGGAFMFGSVNDNGHERLMHSGHVILVKIAYRLGPLGFLSAEDNNITGNFGLKDQRLALQWIKDNIGKFGGDVDSILLMGISAGGASVHLQMLRPSSENIAKVAASFSGTALNPWVILHKSRQRALKMAEILECPNIEDTSEIKKCLKAKDPKDIVSAVRHFLVFGYNPFTTFGPVIESENSENAFLTQAPETIIRSGKFAQIPWLASYVAQDGGYNAAELLQKTSKNRELIYELNDRWVDWAPYSLFFRDTKSTPEDIRSHALQLRQQYLGDKDFSVESYWDVQRMYTDGLFKNGTEEAVRLHRAYAHRPVYSYVYDNPADRGAGTSLARRTDIKLGTNHCDDFFLIFHNPARPYDLRLDEQIISKNLIKMLQDFLQNGNDLQYGDCKFEDNVGSTDKLELMLITKDGCESRSVSSFP